MKNLVLCCLASVAVTAFSTAPVRAAELLINGNFESPASPAGNNIGVVPTGWASSFTGGGTGTSANLVNGSILGTGTSTSLPVYPGDSAGGNAQSFDGVGADVRLTQTITPTVTGPVSISIAFGGRDAGSDTGTGSYWQMFAQAPAGVIGTGSLINPITGQWVTSTTAVTPFSLTAGQNYVFIIYLADAHMVDAASVQTVPEPTTVAALGLGAGLAGLFGLKRFRRA